MSKKIEILTQKIESKTRKLTARWTFDNIDSIVPRKNVKDMTKEEEADEIVRRLSRPYKTRGEMIEDELMQVLSEEIAKEIDEEILKSYSEKWLKKK